MEMDSPKRVRLKSAKPPLWLRLRIRISNAVYFGNNRSGAGNIIRLPFKRVVKLRTHINELEAMEFVRKHTTIPVPKVLEVYVYGEVLHMVMEMVPGDRTGYKDMPIAESQIFAKELADYLAQLRALEPPKEGFVGSLSLGPSLDHRLGGNRFGPFHSVADFHTYLRLGHPVEHWDFEPDVVHIHKNPLRYRIKFSHADLCAENIQSVNGHITGILDWEFAGWYPEYWDYTKMYWGQRPAYSKFYEAIEAEPNIVKYPEELKAEQNIWKHMGPFTYDTPWSPEDDAAEMQQS